jgi:hypothetical protein
MLLTQEPDTLNYRIFIKFLHISYLNTEYCLQPFAIA